MNILCEITNPALEATSTEDIQLFKNCSLKKY